MERMAESCLWADREEMSKCQMLKKQPEKPVPGATLDLSES